jgi:hypothetical protein
MLTKLLLPIGLTAAALGLLHITKPEAPKAGGPPAPPPPPSPAIPPQPAPETQLLKQEIAQLLAQATIAPGTVKPSTLDALAVELDNAGLTAEAARVREKSAELKAQIPVL